MIWGRGIPLVIAVTPLPQPHFARDKGTGVAKLRGPQFTLTRLAVKKGRRCNNIVIASVDCRSLHWLWIITAVDCGQESESASLKIDYIHGMGTTHSGLTTIVM